MKRKLSLYYDEDGDFLEIDLGDFTEGYFKNLGGGLFERIDKKSNQITGMAVMGFKQRTKKLGEVAIPLPWEVEVSA